MLLIYLFTYLLIYFITYLHDLPTDCFADCTACTHFVFDTFDQDRSGSISFEVRNNSSFRSN